MTTNFTTVIVATMNMKYLTEIVTDDCCDVKQCRVIPQLAD